MQKKQKIKAVISIACRLHIRNRPLHGLNGYVAGIWGINELRFAQRNKLTSPIGSFGQYFVAAPRTLLSVHFLNASKLRPEVSALNLVDGHIF